MTRSLPTPLFLGFSFADPNIDVLLRLARRYGTTAADRHLTVLRRPADPAGVQLHGPRVRDLENSGVHVCEISDFSELTPMLQASPHAPARNACSSAGAATRHT